MTLARQMALLIAALLLASTCGSLTLHHWSMREALRQQLLLRQADAATWLAAQLAKAQGDEAAMRAAVSAWFEQGSFEGLTLQAADGRVIADLHQPGDDAVPSWFGPLALPAQAPTHAAIKDGQRNFGQISMQSRTDLVNLAIWRTFWRTAALLALLAAVAAAYAAWFMTRWQRPLQRTVEQAHAVAQGRFTLVEEPQVPELRQLARSMNSMVQRLSTMFEASAAQLSELQRRAHMDGVTRLPNRRHFISRLSAALDGPVAHGHGLLLMRLLDMPGLNERLGHDKVDQVLATLGDVLATYPQRVPDAMTGRLNGADFALALPVAGITRETGESLLVALRTAAGAALGMATPSGSAVEWVIGGVDTRRGCTAAEARTAADAALAEAEAAGPFSLVVQAMHREPSASGGARAWRAQMGLALQQQRVRLDEIAVSDARGKLIHLACPLLLQMDEAGPYQPAARWFGLASRSRLMPRIDLCALELALRESTVDGLPRCVHMATASLASRGFAAEIDTLLARQPTAAVLLRLEIDERCLESAADTLPAVFAVLRRHGTQLGVEHVGQPLRGDVLTRGAALAHVTLRSHLVKGVAGDRALQDLAQGLVNFVHGLGALIIVEGVDSLDDLAALWALGVDGATAVATRDAQMSPQ